MSEMQMRTYDSIETMVADMRAATEQANRWLADAQRRVGWGDTWVRFHIVPGEDRLVIFGQVLPTREALGPDGEDPLERAEREEELLRIKARYDDGFMYSRSFSVNYPDGELGDTHRANLWPLPVSVYDAASKVGWDHKRLHQDQALLLVEVFSNWRAHESAVFARRRNAGR